MGTARKSNRDKAEHDVPHQVLYRETLRANPPPILVTNQTMLEYMTIRREDRKILDASRGKLRWIVIDEAHSYIGSAAAELSLLLRRVMNAFDVTRSEEHTSELQSLMRISYAVFCLNKITIIFLSLFFFLFFY